MDMGEMSVMATTKILEKNPTKEKNWRLPIMQVGEIPSSYSYLIISYKYLRE